MRGLAIILFLALSGCASPNPINCPALNNYSRLEQQVLAQELLLDGPETQKQIEDYISLRKACHEH